MATKRTPRPRDPIQLGKLMVDIATGQVPDTVDNGKKKDTGGGGRLGGLAGGKARAKKLTPEERHAIARKAANVRWKVSSDGEL